MVVEHGVQHIWVSNHGGRQLPDVRSTVEILPEIVAAVKHTGAKIYVDGGIRYGFDIFKCLALGSILDRLSNYLGADFVFIGRPSIWGNAVAGQVGVERVMDILKKELITAMKLCGVNKVSEITSKYVIDFNARRPKL